MAFRVVWGSQWRRKHGPKPASNYRCVFRFQPTTDNTSGLRIWCNYNRVDLYRCHDRITHFKQHRMGRDCVLHPEPARSAPGELSTLARQGRIAIFRLDDKYA